MKEFAKYDVFDYLEIEVRQVTNILDSVIEDYFDKTNDERVEEVHKAFDAVKLHIDHQDKIMRTISHDEKLMRSYARFQAYRDQICDLMSDMVFEHVDDDSFYSDLHLLRGLVSKLGRLEHRRLFAKLREEMSEEEKEQSQEMLSASFP